MGQAFILCRVLFFSSSVGVVLLCWLAPNKLPDTPRLMGKGRRGGMFHDSWGVKGGHVLRPGSGQLTPLRESSGSGRMG